MKKKNVYRRFALLFVCLFPVLISTCGEGDGGRPVVTTLSGRITTPDGSGVQGATVTISGAIGGGFGCTPPLTLTTTTDANGHYVFSSDDSRLASGTGTITPSLAGHGFAPPSRTVTISYGGAVTGQDFTATPLPHVVSGRIVSTGGAALPGVTVTLGGAATRTASTDGNGQYLFAGLENGTYTISPSIPGATFTPAGLTVIVASADVAGKDFTASGYLISGRVTVRGGAASAGVTMNLAGAASNSTATDANGQYAFVAQPGSYTITPFMTPSGYAFTPGSRAITVAADTIGLDFVMEKWIISGRVASYSGGGVPGVQVSLSGTSTTSATTDAQGNFGFIVYQNGSCRITPSLAGFGFTPASLDITVDNANVSVPDFTTNAYTISGRVAVGGAGIPGATVDLSGPASAATVTDSGGAFSFIVAQDGLYIVTPSTLCPTYSFTPSSRTVTVDAADVAVPDFAAGYLSQSTYALAGRVATPAGAGVSGLTVALTGSAAATTGTGPDGAYVFSGLRNGSYSLAPLSAEYAFAPAKRAQGLCNSDVAGQDFTATRTWAKSYSALGYERAYAIRQTSDQGYIVAGYTTIAGLGTWDAWVLRLHPNGDIVWQRSYGGPGTDSISAVQETADGFIVAGSTSSFGAGGSDAWVMKLDAGGDIVWQKAYGGPGDDSAVSVQQVGGGGYVVAGSTSSFGAGGSDAWVMRLDASGTIVWQKTYGGAGWDRAASIRQTTDNGYVAAGSIYSHSPGSLGYYDLWVLKLDSGGNVTWQKSYGGDGDEGANSIEQTADGGYIVAGATSLASSGGIGATGDRFWVLKLDSNGNALWQNTYGGTGGDRAFSVRQTSDNGYVAAGTTYSFGAGYYDSWALKLDPDGNIAWQKAYGTGVAGELAYSAQQTADGGYVAAGVSGSAGDDFLVFKIDPDGNMDGCGFGRNTTAAASSTSFSSIATAAAVSDSTATVTASTSGSTDTSSGATQICPSP